MLADSVSGVPVEVVFGAIILMAAIWFFRPKKKKATPLASVVLIDPLPSGGTIAHTGFAQYCGAFLAIQVLGALSVLLMIIVTSNNWSWMPLPVFFGMLFVSDWAVKRFFPRGFFDKSNARVANLGDRLLGFTFVGWAFVQVFILAPWAFAD